MVPKKYVKVYPNDKPWVTSSLRHGWLKTHNAFSKGVESEQMEAIKAVRADIKRAKIQYKNKIRKIKRQFESSMGGSKTVYESDSDLSEALNLLFTF